jgi:MFS family permease
MLAVRLVTFGYMIVWHILLPLLPVYTGTLGATPVQVGLLVSLMTGISFFFCLHLGTLADAIGPRRAAQIASVTYTAALVTLFFGRTLWSVAAALGLIGLSNIALVIATETYVAAATTTGNRAEAFSTLALWASAGSLIGPVIGGVVARRWGFESAFGVTIAFVVTVVAAASWAIPRTHPTQTGRPGPLATYRMAATLANNRVVLFLLLVNFVAMSAFSLRQSFYPVFMGQIGLSTASIGAIMSIMGLATMLARPILPPALRWLGSIRLLALILGLIVVGLAVTPSLSTFWSLAGAISILGFALGLLGPLSTTLITEQAPASAWGSAISLRVMSLQFAQLVGPSITGLIVGSLGLPAAFYFSAIVAASGLLAVGALARVTAPLLGSTVQASKPG